MRAASTPSRSPINRPLTKNPGSNILASFLHAIPSRWVGIWRIVDDRPDISQGDLTNEVRRA